MRIRAQLLALLSLTTAAKFVPADTAGTDRLAWESYQNVRARFSLLPNGLPGARNGLLGFAEAARQFCGRVHAMYHPRPARNSSTCTLTTASVRREWDTLSLHEKRLYIDAVLCLTSKPALSGDAAPGARSRYDDFFAVHVNQTLSIHGTGNFLSWHRYFVHTYEQALRNECGYKGTFPYLNYGRYAFDLRNAAIFDGSDTSLSGNGCFDLTYNGTYIPSAAQPNIRIPAEGGGGCITSGPFVNHSVNLGPVVPALSNVPANPQQNGLGYNPRCIRRDISAYAASLWANDGNITALITDSPHIGAFQTTLQGNFTGGFLGVHTAAHFFVGGDPGGDIFASCGDPFFWPHHAQIDRLWWIWQNLDASGARYLEIANTTTVNNVPPSRNATLDDIIDLGVNAPGIKIREAVDTLSGPFCYVYQ